MSVLGLHVVMQFMLVHYDCEICPFAHFPIYQVWELLWTWQWNFGFYKRRGTFFLTCWATVSFPRKTLIRWLKGKVVSVLFFLTEHHAMKAYWGSGGIAWRILWPRHQMEVSGRRQKFKCERAIARLYEFRHCWSSQWESC